MRIILDGQKLSANLRTTKDLLLTIKSLAGALYWRTLYDPTKEVIYISTTQTNLSLEEIISSAPIIEELESVRCQGKIICIDPGHGGNDPGTIGTNGTCEKDNTLAIAMLLKEKLENNGASVIMTRHLENERGTDDAPTSLMQRLLTINDAQADLFISIHNDSFSSSDASGTTTFHYGNEPSIRLAHCLQSAIVNELGTADRGTRFASFYLLRYAEIPGILIETAFISNPEEEVLLASTDGRNKIAESMYQGIMRYFKV